MKKIKIFKSHLYKILEKEVNEWIENNFKDIIIININQSTCNEHIVLIIFYEEK